MQGLSGTTLAKVADRAGVSQGVLVFHFKSKSGLLNATCRHLIEDYMQLWQPALDLINPAERITGLVRADFDPSICSPQQLALWFAFWGEGNAHNWYDDFCRDAERQRTDAMIDTCRALVPSENPEILAQSIDCFIDGLWLQMHLQGEKVTPQDAQERALGHLHLLLPNIV
ncbi:transcriptional regulator, TetR family [Shimia gijangensis]|uniref:Transcriptional regulator, TetR family n=2 Tax=Shimia gijangensis TaxID=1470563 RepID=A0A1M6GEY8_9RHOB|nr:transcriptional regulator, TetR family [Shimia gijangensis]